MFLLYIFAFIIHGVLAAPPCEHGVELVSTETKNPEDLLGNWTYVYSWDNKIPFSKGFHYQPPPSPLQCPQLHFEAITPEFVKAKEAECAKYKMPFNWADAKLKADVSLFKMKEDRVIIIGEKEIWMVADCITMSRVVLKKVSDDYIAIVSHGKNIVNLLTARDPPNFDELKCVINNLDVGKGIDGYEICYK